MTLYPYEIIFLVKRNIIGSTIVVIGCDFIQDSIDENIEIKKGEFRDEEKEIEK